MNPTVNQIVRDELNKLMAKSVKAALEGESKTNPSDYQKFLSHMDAEIIDFEITDSKNRICEMTVKLKLQPKASSKRKKERSRK